jgi:pimeloyl-ACP methyl ester carboxylesterase
LAPEDDMTDKIRPFEIAATDAQLDDLKRRLQATRWPERETVDDWTQGAPLAWVQEVCAYWAEKYDWREREARLNAFDQFKTEIDGLGIHFVHVRSPHAEAKPLVITHGWPGSIVEFHKVIGPLTDPPAHGGDAADAFHVVCPTLPGFGFSDKPTDKGWGTSRIADAWSQLMQRLGYDRYFAPPDPETMNDLSEAEQSALAGMKYYQDHDSGYSKQQSTRPQTVGYGLVDSPAGQAAWILEKFWAWTDCDGHPENVLTRDELLDNVMLYWLPAAGASSARIYWESFNQGGFDPVTVPAGASVFPKEIFRTSRRWFEKRFQNVAHFNVLDRGGHFAAFEVPEVFVDEVRTCFRGLR